MRRARSGVAARMSEVYGGQTPFRVVRLTSDGNDAGDEGKSRKSGVVDSGARPVQALPPW